MRLKDSQQVGAVAVNRADFPPGLMLSSTSGLNFSFFELSSTEDSSGDVLLQLDSNLSRLEDLQGRLSFVVREVQHLVTKN